jgi:hypothetical protein
MAATLDTSRINGGEVNGFMRSQEGPNNYVLVKRHRGENSGLHYSFFGGRVTIGEACILLVRNLSIQQACCNNLLCLIAMCDGINDTGGVSCLIVKAMLLQPCMLAGPDYYGLLGSIFLLVIPAGAPSYIFILNAM